LPNFLQDEKGSWSSARLALLGSLSMGGFFGLMDLLTHAVKPEIFDLLKVIGSGGAAGQMGPRIASYFSPAGKDASGGNGPCARDESEGVEATP
jgi:hypothetical protein